MKFPRVVYAIKHNQTQRMYIGSSSNVDSRIRAHLSMLRTGKHINKSMQDDYNRYGENFSFYELATINSYAEKNKEYEFQKKYKTKDPEFGYNYADKGGTAYKIHLITEMPEIPE